MALFISLEGKRRNTPTLNVQRVLRGSKCSVAWEDKTLSREREEVVQRYWNMVGRNVFRSRVALEPLLCRGREYGVLTESETNVKVLLPHAELRK